MTAPSTAIDGSANGNGAVPRTSDILLALARESPAEGIALGAIGARLKDRAFGILLFILGICGWIPILPPGVASIFGIGMMVVAGQMAVGRAVPWLPGRLERARIEARRFSAMTLRVLPVLRRFETFARPRYLGPPGGRRERLLGAFMVLLGLLVVIPLPMTNAGPALGVAMIAVGLLERDGLICALGVVVGVAAIFGMLLFYAGALAAFHLLFG